jgi:hypothetical protein
VGIAQQRKLQYRAKLLLRLAQAGHAIKRTFEFIQTRYLFAHGLEMLERSIAGVLWPATAMVPSNRTRYCEGGFQSAHQTSERDKVAARCRLRRLMIAIKGPSCPGA